MAGQLALTIEAGATFARTLVWKDANGTPKPLAGYTARMQIRQKISDPEPVEELTTENGGITLTDPGQIDLRIAASNTALLTIKSAVYDLELVDGSTVPETVTRLLQGTVTISPEVTRAP